MTSTELEQRLTRVEQEVARLKSERKASPRHPVQALEGIHNTFQNDQAFQEAARLGRQWRRARRTAGRKKESGK